MLNGFVTLIIMAVAIAGNFLPLRSVWDDISDNFGAISFPTSLDTLTNPSATDSVATVSHSSQHSNANDAIEALEAKLRIDGSLVNGNTVFVSDGTNSGYSTWATTTSLSVSSATTSNLLVNASTTLLGTLTFINATGTSATTTNLNTTNATGTNIYGFGLPGSTCAAGTSKVLYNAGKFSCGSDQTSTGSVKATTTAITAYSTTTALTSGNTLAIWAKCSFSNTGTVSSALYVKPASGATSSALSVATQSINGGATLVSTQVNFGVYTVSATENHEIYIGTNDANKNYAGCVADTVPTIMYIIF